MQDVAHSLVALRCQVKVIVHVLVGDAAVGVDEARVNVEEGGVWEGRYSLLYQLVHLGVSISHRVWHFAPRQYALETYKYMSQIESPFTNKCIFESLK